MAAPVAECDTRIDLTAVAGFLARGFGLLQALSAGCYSVGPHYAEDSLGLGLLSD